MESDSIKGNQVLYYDTTKNTYFDLTSDLETSPVRISADRYNWPWVLDVYGHLYSYNGFGWNREFCNKHTDSNEFCFKAIDLGVSSSGVVYIIDTYGQAKKVDYNMKERIYLKEAKHAPESTPTTEPFYSTVATNVLKNKATSSHI